MPSTYTLNNGIELIGTGEQSGTWGDTTNTNLGLLDVALDGQVTVALASAGSSGSPNALPISDGTASNGRNRMVVFSDSGDLGATAYVKLTPNDAEKIIYIRNSLSGSRSVILFQGTYNASNDYEVPAGTTAIVYFDGAGAGAVAANVFNNAYFDGLRLGSVSVTAILDEDNMASNSATALATQQSIKAYVDAQVDTVDTLAEILAIGNTTGGTDLAVSTGDDITFADSSKAIFGAGSDLQIYHNTAGFTGNIIASSGTSLYIRSDNLYLQKGDGTENNVIAISDGAVTLSFNNIPKLATTATGIDVTGTVVADGLTVDGGNTIRLNAASGDDFLTIDQGAADATITANSAAGNANLVLSTTASGAVKKRVDIAYNGDISFYEDLGVTAKLFWDASAERLIIGDNTVTPAADAGDLVVGGSTGNNGITIGSATTGTGSLRFADTGGTGRGIVLYDHSSDFMNFQTAGAERMRIDSSGNVGIGTSSPAYKLEIIDGASRFFYDSTTFGIIADTAGGYGRYLKIWNSDATGDNKAVGLGNLSGALVFGTGFQGDTEDPSDGEAMRIISTGSVGIGTTSPQQVLHISQGTSATTTALRIENTDTTIDVAQVANAIEFYTNDASAGGTGVTGKISHVAENAGTTYALAFSSYNASALIEAMRILSTGSVGIGVSDPSELLEVGGATSNNYIQVSAANNSASGIKFRSDSSNTTGSDVGYEGDGNYLFFRSDIGGTVTNRMVIDNGTGNVGIGTSSPDTTLTVIGGGVAEFRLGNIGVSSNSAIRISRNDTIVSSANPLGYLEFGGNDSTGNVDMAFAYVGGVADGSHTAGNNPTALTFGVTASGSEVPVERVRLDSDGNVLVGKTASAGTTAGAELRSDGYGVFTRSGAESIQARRLSTDGGLVVFLKDTTAVGSIGTDSGYLHIANNNDTGLRFAGTDIRPCTSTGANSDGNRDLGDANARFKDLYLSGGVYLGGAVAANLLDDYEEGTWTPEIADATTGGNVGSATVSYANYTKVGNKVTIAAQLLNINTTGMTAGNILFVRGLPYSSATQIAYGACLPDNVTFQSTRTGMVVQVSVADTWAIFQQYGSAITDTGIDVGDLNSGSADIIWSITYFTNQ